MDGVSGSGSAAQALCLPGTPAGVRLCSLFLAAALLLAPSVAAAANSACDGLRRPCADIEGFSNDTFEITWNGKNNSSPQRRHCAISNRPNRGPTIDVTATGTGPGGTFELTGPGGTIGFRVQYRNPTGGRWTTLTAGTPRNFDSLTEAQFDACDSSGSNAGGQRLRIRVLDNDLEAAPAGTYTGTVTLTIETPVGSGVDSETSGTMTVVSPPLMNFIRLKNNFNFGTWDAVGSETNTDNSICIWTNDRTTVGGLASYQVTATTSDGAFEATSNTAEPLDFTVYWANSGGVNSIGSATELVYGTPQVFTTTGTSENCAGRTNNASMLVFFDEAGLSDATASTTPYTSTVVVEVAIPP